MASGARGIQVLSLFCVDKVAHYVDPDGLVRTLFDQHFEQLKHGCPSLAGQPADQVRAAYFATKRRRGAVSSHAVQTTGCTAADAVAYQLIMRDKSRLLSREEPAAFIFSHSALREGWDNPNIFQVCTLAPRTSQIRRRQEIGRGVRLCVDALGRRVNDASVDVLSVIPAEPYEAFVAAWRAELDGPDQAPTPTRAGIRAPPRTLDPLPATAWVELDSRALVEFAVAQLTCHAEHNTVPPPDPVLIAALLARLRPTIALTRSTVAAVVAGAPPGCSAHQVTAAIAAAVAAQGG